MCLLAVLAVSATVMGVGDPSPSEQVIGLSMGGDNRAYPLSLFESNPVVNDEVGRMAVVVFYSREDGFAAAFFRLVSGEPLEFSGQAVGKVADDLTTSTRWDLTTGKAVGGNLLGQKLIPIPARKLALADWRQKFPKGTLFSR